MAEVVGIVLAVVGTADLTIKTGRELAKKIKHFRSAEKEIEEYRQRISDRWTLVEFDIEFIRELNLDTHLNPSLSTRLKKHFQGMLKRLQQHLEVAKVEFQEYIDELSSIPFILKARYAIKTRTTLCELMKNLSIWHDQIKPPMWLFVRMSTPEVDTFLSRQKAKNSSNATVDTMQEFRVALNVSPPKNQLQKHAANATIFKEDRLRWFTPVNFSSTQLATFESSDRLLLDTVRFKPDTDIKAATEGIHELARVLQRVDPFTFGMLACSGICERYDKNRNLMCVQYVFAIPRSLDRPGSLRALLISSDKSNDVRYSLNDRIQLACSIAKSVLFVHSAAFVHKYIRADTIIIFKDVKNKDPEHLGTPFLVGFQKIRLDSAATPLEGDENWERNIYCHPDRQGSYLETRFEMRHDIYSLGVCLLEIGLWSSFIHWDPKSKSYIPGRQLDIQDIRGNNNLSSRERAEKIKSRIISIAKDKLPRVVGKKYADVVVSCLTCLENDNDTWLLNKNDDDNSLIGVCFAEKVLHNLEEISV